MSRNKQTSERIHLSKLAKHNTPLATLCRHTCANRFSWRIRRPINRKLETVNNFTYRQLQDIFTTVDMTVVAYLLKRSGTESKYEEDVIVWHEYGGYADDDHCPLAEEEDRLTTDEVGQRREAYRSEHDAHRENRLRQVFEVFTFAHEVPLQPRTSQTSVLRCRLQN